MSETYELKFGDIDFSPGASDDIAYEVRSFRRGAPAPVTVVALSMIQDGQDERVTSHANRDQTILIGFKGSDSQVLAQAESALFLEAQKARNELTWTPPDGYGAPTVFDVLWSSLEFIDSEDWDLDETMRGLRVYALTVRALPFGRSDTEVVTDALASGAVPSSTTISDGTSATNWTGTSTVTSSGGSLQQTVTTTLLGFGSSFYEFRYSSTAEWIYTPGAPLDFSSEVYPSFDFDPPGGVSSGWMNYAETKLFADGVEQIRVAVDQPTDTIYRLTFLDTDTSVASLRIVTVAETSTTTWPIPSTAVHKLDNVVKSNQAPNASTTGRQSLRTVAVEGSARTQATLSVQHESTALGTTLVYTAPSLDDSTLGYQPPLRRWRTAGSIDTPDSTSISGTLSRLTGGSGATFNIPSSVLPRGTGVLVGRLRMSNVTARTGKVTWSAATNVGGTLYGAKTYTSGTLSLNGSGGAQKFLTLGSMTLPPTDLPTGSSGTVQLDTFTWSGSDNVNFDELWWFWLGEDAALSWVDATGFKRLWIDPATLGSDPAAWVGNASDRSDALNAGAFSTPFAQHSFRPTSMNVFVATETAANPAVALRHFPRWHTHAEQLES